MTLDAVIADVRPRQINAGFRAPTDALLNGEQSAKRDIPMLRATENEAKVPCSEAAAYAERSGTCESPFAYRARRGA